MSPPGIGPPARALVPERVEARPAGTSVLDRSSVRASIEPRTRVGQPNRCRPIAKTQVTISHETHDKLRRAQDLFRHTEPHGDIAAILDRALALLLADLERRRCAATAAPRCGSPSTGHTRYIPAAVRREVWRRDQGTVRVVGTRGRCRETGLLEFTTSSPSPKGGRRRLPISNALPGSQPIRGVAVLRKWFGRCARGAARTLVRQRSGERIARTLMAALGWGPSAGRRRRCGRRVFPARVSGPGANCLSRDLNDRSEPVIRGAAHSRRHACTGSVPSGRRFAEGRVSGRDVIK